MIPRGLTFTWWGCCGLCLLTETNRACPFRFFYSVPLSISVFMALSTVFHSLNSPDNSLLSSTLFFWSYFCLVGPFNYLSLCESLLQPRCNLLWLTGLKARTNQLKNSSSFTGKQTVLSTIYLCMKVSFSPDVIFCG